MTNFDPAIHTLGMKLKFVYSIVGLLLGAGCILAGVVLSLAGAVGHTSWTASALGFSTNMSDATPGVIVFVVGIFFVLITRFKVKQINTIPPTPTNATIAERTQDKPATPGDEASTPQSGGSSAPGYSSGGQSSLSYTTKF